MDDNNNIKKEKSIKDSPDPLSIKDTEEIIEQMKYGVCKILKNKGMGTGFFVKISLDGKKLPVLITNNHVIDQDDIDKNIIVTLKLNNYKISKNISLKNRLMYTNKDLDVTIIEIKENNDDLENIYLELDETNKSKNHDEEINNFINTYGNQSIYLIGYPEDKDGVVVSYAGAPDISYKSNIQHDCSTNEGSSGSPILSIKNKKLIGYHHSSKGKHNYGTLLITAINKFKKVKRNELEKEKEVYKINNNTINNYNKYIIGEFYITEDKVNTDIKIINSYEQFFKERNKQKALEYKKEFENEKDIKKNCEIIIDNVQYDFSYYYKFNKEGTHTIKYNFEKNIEKIDYMFCNCTSLKKIDFTNYNNDKVINMRCIFLKCTSLTDIILSKNRYKINDISGMVCKCTSLKELDLSCFNTNETTNMSAMFGQCTSLRQINLSNFNFDKVNDMSCMFYDCSSLEKIIISKFNFKKPDISDIFYGCNNLANIIKN